MLVGSATTCRALQKNESSSGGVRADAVPEGPTTRRDLTRPILRASGRGKAKLALEAKQGRQLRERNRREREL